MSMEAIQKVKGPALGLQIAAGLGGVMTLLSLIMNMMGMEMGPPQDPSLEAYQTIGNVVGTIIGLAIAGFVWMGASKMKELRGYGMAIAASIVAMIPCSCGCLVGLPIGIWALIVLMKPEVKEAFQG